MLQSVKKNSHCKMAKRGRKPNEKKGYFYEKEEKAIVDYINEENIDNKNKIFNTILYPALTKMIESIIRRYKLFVPDEEFEQNFSDTISYLLTKIDHFRPVITGYFPYEGDINGIEFVEMPKDEFELKKRNASEDDPKFVKINVPAPAYEEDAFPQHYLYYVKMTCHYKAYSYCGTVCKNYLMYKCSQYSKKKLRNTPYDDVFEEISNSQRYLSEDENYTDTAEKLIRKTADGIESMIAEAEKNELTENEIIVGNALVNLMRNWENVLPTNGSNKLQKSSVLYFLREETMMTTKEVRDNMKCYRNMYYLLKRLELEE